MSLRHPQNTDPDSRAHGVGPENRPETVAVNGAAQYLGQEGQPDPFDAPGADGVESASEPAFHAIVYCARKEKRRDRRQEPEEQQGFCVAAPEQEQHVDHDEGEEGPARKRQHQRHHHHPHRRQQRESQSSTLRFGPREEQQRVSDRVQAPQVVGVLSERRKEFARVVASKLTERDPGLGDEHDHDRAHHPNRYQRGNEKLFRLLRLRYRGTDQEGEYHHRQRLDHEVANVAGRVVEFDLVVHEERGRNVADVTRTQRAGDQDWCDVQP